MPSLQGIVLVLRTALAAAALGSAALLAQTPTWLLRQTAVSPGACDGHLAYDAARGETVLLGFGCNQTWTWNGAQWTQRAAPPLGFATLTYDSLRQVVVAVVGGGGNVWQTWEWNGSGWALRFTGSAPLPRYNHALAFDAARGVTVLFGGTTGPGFASGDTWTWNGAAWTQVALGGPPGPSARLGSAMCFDAARSTVLLFGGQSGQSMPYGDTWEWNGSSWMPRVGVSGPSARSFAHLAFDTHRGRAVLQGGVTTGFVVDTWEWNGSAWTQVLPAASPDQHLLGVTYDSARGMLVSWAAGTWRTWEYLAGPTVAATFATYGSGCAGPAGVPQLTNVAGSLPRIGTTLQLQLTNLPASPFHMPIGFVGFDATTWLGVPLPVSLTPLGFTGCSAWLAPATNELLANVAGTATWNVPIPMSALALGADVYFQGGVFVPGWTPGGFVFSNAGHAVVGSP